MPNIREFNVGDLMEETDLVATQDQRLSDVLGKMMKAHVHEMPVVEKGKVTGIIDLDILLKFRRVPLTSEVKHVMVPNPMLSPEDTLPKAAKIMITSDLKVLPVCEDGMLLGIVSRADLIAKIPLIDELKDILPLDVMTPGPKVVNEMDTADQAGRLMHDLDERAVPVVNKNGLLTGIVEIFSLMHLMEMSDASSMSKDKEIRGRRRGQSGGRTLVRDIMRDAVASISKKSTMKNVVDMMGRTGSTMVVITDRGLPVGIITQWDLLEVVAAMEETEGVHVQITGLAHQVAGVFDGMYGMVQKFIEKVPKSVHPTMLHIHGIEHMKDGRTVRYNVSARLVTRRAAFTAHKEGFALFDALGDCLYSVEHQIKKDSEQSKRSWKGR